MKLDLLEQRTFIGYLLSCLRQTSIFALYSHISAYLRRFLFVTRIARWASIAFRVIESSVILIFLCSILLCLLPIVIVILVIAAICDYFGGKRILSSQALLSAMERERIYCITHAGTFGEGFAAELAKSGTVFVITADLRRPFFCARQEDGVFYIRHAFFFKLKRKYFCKMNDKMRWLL